MSDPRAINPSRCWIRHVRRTVDGEVGITVGRGAYIADGTSDLGGRQGWQSGTIAFALSDDGEGTFRFPNAAGADGRLHRRRFGLLTDPAYRIGEEWLEVYRDADELVAVITPRSYSLSRSELVIKGPDVAGVLGRFRSSDLEPWLGAAPRDVLEHYTRAPILADATDYRGLTGVPASGAATGTTPQGITYHLQAGATTATGPDGELIVNGATGNYSGAGRFGLTDVAADCWIVEGRLRVLSENVAGAAVLIAINLYIAGNAITDAVHISVIANLLTGELTITGAAAAGAYPGPDVTGGTVEVARRAGTIVKGTHTLRIACFYDRLFVFLDGELAAEVRRPAPLRAPTGAILYVSGGGAGFDALTVESLADFALRGADKGDRHLPGVPPAVGLRARIYATASMSARYPINAAVTKRLPARVGDEPATERLDPAVNFALGTIAPTVPNFAAVWTGAIYLDLAASDRRIRLTFSSGNIRSRLYVGKTRAGLDEAIDDWLAAGPSPKVTVPLRSLLGSKAGWYPIRIEAASSNQAVASLILEDGAADAGGVVALYATVPQSRLSPIGTYDELVRLESHRELLGQVADMFGYQWRVEPRQLESGEFPGQIIPRVRVGFDADLRVTVDRAVDVAVEGDAGDAVDVLTADAAGIADPKGSGQLSARIIDVGNARAHAFTHGDYDSLSEISEAPMLETRLGSLLALRSGVNENVGARPDGQRDLVDTFPLTGASTRLDWRPGDGVLLDLDDVDVRDTGPRQLTRVEWPIVPDGYGRPAVGFRQRPRSAAAVLRRALRIALSTQRNYQGTFVVLPGTYGAANGLGAISPGAADHFARLPLPTNLEDVVEVTLTVTGVVGSWVLYINGASTGITITTVGRYDVTRWVARTGGTTTDRIYARLDNPNPAVAGSNYEIALSALVKV
jgi:hypothetical protein